MEFHLLHNQRIC